MVKRAHKQLDVWREGVVLATYVYQMRFLQYFKQAYFIVQGLLNNGVQEKWVASMKKMEEQE